MRNSIDSYRGEAPRLTPRALPPNAAQIALNARLMTGDLEAWRQFAVEQALENAGPVRSIFKLGDVWLSWDEDVDVAHGALAGDITRRVFLTGDAYDRPRWTNYALATSGAAPYPVETRPLGVPAPESAPVVEPGIDPNPTSFTVDILDDGGQLATSWTKSPFQNAHGGVTDVIDMGDGNGYQLLYDDNPGAPAFMYRNFGVAAVNVLRMSFDFTCTSGSDNYLQMCAGLARTQGGAGIQVSMDGFGVLGTGSFGIAVASGWNTTGSSALSLVPISTIVFDVPYTCEVTMVKNADGTQTVTATLYLGSAQIAVAVVTNTFQIGDFCGLLNETTFSDGVDRYRTFYNNILVQGSGATGYVASNTATSYVITYKNDQNEESAPSFASVTVLRPPGVSILVTTSPDVPTGIDSSWHIQTKAIYRSVSGATGTIFRFVAEIPLAQVEYLDSIPDTELGEELESEGWALPPVGMRGILALPNGVMAGFVDNQLCLSAQNRPHAWPLKNRYTIDTKVVAIGNIDSTVVIGSESFPYLAIGTTPGDYSMTKLEVPQSCVAKRSLAYLIGFGVVFASPDGLIAISGNGSVQNLTRGVFTRNQWQALVPSSILGIAHDDVYHFFYDRVTEPVAHAGYAMDMKSDGFGIVPLAYRATAAFADPLTDELQLVLDEDDEPTATYLPLPSTAPVPDGLTIYTFDAEDGDGQMVYLWRGKLNLLPNPAAFSYCQVRAADYENLVLRLYGDGVLFFERVITGQEPFTLPLGDTYTSFEIELVGTSRVRAVQVAEDIGEFD